MSIMNKTIILTYADGRTETRTVCGNAIAASEIPDGVITLDFQPERFEAHVGDLGYFILPVCVSNHLGHGGLIYFRERSDLTTAMPYQTMPVYAVSRGNSGTLAIVTGMPLDYELVVEVARGRYRLFPRFHFNGSRPTEDISVIFIELGRGDADYSAIARRYRRYQLERGACIPLKERIKHNPVLRENVRSIGVRMRLAWKMVPPPVVEQTEANEPPVFTAITFERAEKILDELYRQGVRHASFCLVGWNKSGHDGRFPDLLPVEPMLGGEAGLRKLLRKAKHYGYLMGAHTNLTDSYTISKRLDRNKWLLDHNGEPVKGGQWGGGQSYFLCPEAALEYAHEDMRTLQDLGFHGVHYFDVLTMENPLPCYNPRHPLTRTEAGARRGDILELARRAMGAVASEGAMDFCIGSIDEILYSVFRISPENVEICDEFIPFWHLVYHGIVLYNSFGESINAMIKHDPELALKNEEFGGRPQAYFYAKFLSAGRAWMGEEDLICNNDEELQCSVKALKKAAEEYEKVWALQLEFMEDHKKIAEGIFETTYSNGVICRIDYHKKTKEYYNKKKTCLCYS